MSTVVSSKQCIVKKNIRQLVEMDMSKLETGKDLGIFSLALSIALTSKHFEMTLILELEHSGSKRWFGFYFLGGLKSLEKCFQKKYLDLTVIYKMLEETIDLNEPNINPLLLVGKDIEHSQAFWQVKSPENKQKTVGFVPLVHRSSVFHGLSQYPIISFEHQHMEKTEKATLILVSDTDRNTLLPDFPEVDEELTTFLKKLSHQWTKHNWKLIHWDSERNTQPFKMEESDYESFAKSHWTLLGVEISNLIGPLHFFVNGRLVFFENCLFSVSSFFGRTHFRHILYFWGGNHPLNASTFQTKSNETFDSLKKLMELMGQGVSLYNPFMQTSGLKLVKSVSLSNPSAVERKLSTSSAKASNESIPARPRAGTNETQQALSNLSLHSETNESTNSGILDMLKSSLEKTEPTTTPIATTTANNNNNNNNNLNNEQQHLIAAAVARAFVRWPSK